MPEGSSCFGDLRSPPGEQCDDIVGFSAMAPHMHVSEEMMLDSRSMFAEGIEDLHLIEPKIVKTIDNGFERTQHHEFLKDLPLANEVVFYEKHLIGGARLGESMDFEKREGKEGEINMFSSVMMNSRSMEEGIPDNMAFPSDYKDEIPPPIKEEPSETTLPPAPLLSNDISPPFPPALPTHGEQRPNPSPINPQAMKELVKSLPHSTGVHFHFRKMAWVANTGSSTEKQTQKCFDVKKYGFYESREMAIRWRRKNVNTNIPFGFLSRHRFPLGGGGGGMNGGGSGDSSNSDSRSGSNSSIKGGAEESFTVEGGDVTSGVKRKQMYSVGGGEGSYGDFNRDDLGDEKAKRLRSAQLYPTDDRANEYGIDVYNTENMKTDNWKALADQLPRIRGVTFKNDRQVWMAQWAEKGHMKGKVFSVNRYGFSKAREYAIAYRQAVSTVPMQVKRPSCSQMQAYKSSSSPYQGYSEEKTLQNPSPQYLSLPKTADEASALRNLRASTPFLPEGGMGGGFHHPQAHLPDGLSISSMEVSQSGVAATPTPQPFDSHEQVDARSFPPYIPPWQKEGGMPVTAEDLPEVYNSNLKYDRETNCWIVYLNPPPLPPANEEGSVLYNRTPSGEVAEGAENMKGGSPQPPFIPLAPRIFDATELGFQKAFDCAVECCRANEALINKYAPSPPLLGGVGGLNNNTQQHYGVGRGGLVGAGLGGGLGGSFPPYHHLPPHHPSYSYHSTGSTVGLYQSDGRGSMLLQGGGSLGHTPNGGGGLGTPSLTTAATTSDGISSSLPSCGNGYYHHHNSTLGDSAGDGSGFVGGRDGEELDASFKPPFDSSITPSGVHTLHLVGEAVHGRQQGKEGGVILPPLEAQQRDGISSVLRAPPGHGDGVCAMRARAGSDVGWGVSGGDGGISQEFEENHPPGDSGRLEPTYNLRSREEGGGVGGGGQFRRVENAALDNRPVGGNSNNSKKSLQMATGWGGEKATHNVDKIDNSLQKMLVTEELNLPEGVWLALAILLPKHRGVNYHKYCQCWVAAWCDSGKQLKKRFPVRRHGFLNARQLAMEHRKRNYEWLHLEGEALELAKVHIHQELAAQELLYIRCLQDIQGSLINPEPDIMLYKDTLVLIVECVYKVCVLNFCDFDTATKVCAMHSYAEVSPLSPISLQNILRLVFFSNSTNSRFVLHYLPLLVETLHELEKYPGGRGGVFNEGGQSSVGGLPLNSGDGGGFGFFSPPSGVGVQGGLPPGSGEGAGFGFIPPPGVGIEGNLPPTSAHGGGFQAPPPPGSDSSSICVGGDAMEVSSLSQREAEDASRKGSILPPQTNPTKPLDGLQPPSQDHLDGAASPENLVQVEGSLGEAGYAHTNSTNAVTGLTVEAAKDVEVKPDREEQGKVLQNATATKLVEDEDGLGSADVNPLQNECVLLASSRIARIKVCVSNEDLPASSIKAESLLGGADVCETFSSYERCLEQELNQKYEGGVEKVEGRVKKDKNYENCEKASSSFSPSLPSLPPSSLSFLATAPSQKDSSPKSSMSKELPYEQTLPSLLPEAYDVSVHITTTNTTKSPLPQDPLLEASAACKPLAQASSKLIKSERAAFLCSFMREGVYKGTGEMGEESSTSNKESEGCTYATTNATGGFSSDTAANQQRDQLCNVEKEQPQHVWKQMDDLGLPLTKKGLLEDEEATREEREEKALPNSAMLMTSDALYSVKADASSCSLTASSSSSHVKPLEHPFNQFSTLNESTPPPLLPKEGECGAAHTSSDYVFCSTEDSSSLLVRKGDEPLGEAALSAETAPEDMRTSDAPISSYSGKQGESAPQVLNTQAIDTATPPFDTNESSASSLVEQMASASLPAPPPRVEVSAHGLPNNIRPPLMPSPPSSHPPLAHHHLGGLESVREDMQFGGKGGFLSPPTKDLGRQLPQGDGPSVQSQSVEWMRGSHEQAACNTHTLFQEGANNTRAIAASSSFPASLSAPAYETLVPPQGYGGLMRENAQYTSSGFYEPMSMLASNPQGGGGFTYSSSMGYTEVGNIPHSSLYGWGGAASVQEDLGGEGGVKMVFSPSQHPAFNERGGGMILTTPPPSTLVEGDKSPHPSSSSSSSFPSTFAFSSSLVGDDNSLFCTNGTLISRPNDIVSASVDASNANDDARNGSNNLPPNTPSAHTNTLASPSLSPPLSLCSDHQLHPFVGLTQPGGEDHAPLMNDELANHLPPPSGAPIHTAPPSAAPLHTAPPHIVSSYPPPPHQSPPPPPTSPPCHVMHTATATAPPSGYMRLPPMNELLYGAQTTESAIDCIKRQLFAHMEFIKGSYHLSGLKMYLEMPLLLHCIRHKILPYQLALEDQLILVESMGLLAEVVQLIGSVTHELSSGDLQLYQRKGAVESMKEAYQALGVELRHTVDDIPGGVAHAPLPREKGVREKPATRSTSSTAHGGSVKTVIGAGGTHTYPHAFPLTHQQLQHGAGIGGSTTTTEANSGSATSIGITSTALNSTVLGGGSYFSPQENKHLPPSLLQLSQHQLNVGGGSVCSLEQLDRQLSEASTNLEDAQVLHGLAASGASLMREMGSIETAEGLVLQPPQLSLCVGQGNGSEAIPPLTHNSSMSEYVDHNNGFFFGCSSLTRASSDELSKAETFLLDGSNSSCLVKGGDSEDGGGFMGFNRDVSREIEDDGFDSLNSGNELNMRLQIDDQINMMIE